MHRQTWVTIALNLIGETVVLMILNQVAHNWEVNVALTCANRANLLNEEGHIQEN